MNIPFLLGWLWGSYEESKKQEINYNNVDIENLENVLANSKIAQNGKKNYYTGDEKYEDRDQIEKVDEKSYRIINRLVHSANLTRDEVHHLINKLTE